MKLKELLKELGIEKDNSEDLHITRSFSTLAAVSKGKVIKMTDPFLKYCPLFIWLEIDREKELGKIQIKTSIEKKISKFGYFTKKRRLHSKKIVVPYGASEMIMYAMKKRTMDCAVVVCDGAGTVIVPEPEIVQGIGARMNGLFYTSPIAETIDKLRNSNCQIVFPEARIDQVKGLEKAAKLGYKNIAVTISGFLGDGLSKIREIEKKYNVSATVMIVCTTGVTEEKIKEIGKYADIVWSCASEGIRETIGRRSILQVSTGIPVFVLTQKGLELVANYCSNEKALVKLDVKKQYLISGKHRGKRIKIGDFTTYLSEAKLPVRDGKEPKPLR